MPVVRFGIFEVDLQSGEVRKSGVRIRVQQQPIKVLEILLERPGEVVTRDDLRRRVWPEESFGDFDQAVNVAIAKLRSALSDSAEHPRYIETLPKRGYRFIAPVLLEDAEAKSDEIPSKEISVPGSGVPDGPGAQVLISAGSRRRGRTLWIFLAAALVLGGTILAIWLSRYHRSTPHVIRSLAVLPLDNLSGDDSQNYFADGMTDELITDLAKISALRVVSRTSVMQYKNSRKPLPQIARELDVDAVVEGSVLRSGQQVRITAQLIQAPADEHLWGESYEGDLRDTLALQKKVASSIAEQIRIELTPREKAALKNTGQVNAAAYEDYLRGRFFWNKRTAESLKKAIEYFNQAIVQDPNYAQAYAGLADSYALAGDWQYSLLPSAEALPKAKAAAARALELDDNLGEAHASLAFAKDVFDWDWPSAENEFRRAIDLNPGYATAHHWYAWHLAVMGRNNEAIAEMKKAVSLDPLSLIINADLAEQLLIARFYPESIEQSRKTIEMDPNFAVAHYDLGQALVQMHKYAEGIAELELAVRLSGSSPVCTSHLAHAYALSGRRKDALKIVADLSKNHNDFSNAPEIALVYVGLEDNNQALNWLEKAFAQRFNPSILLRPCFDPLRSDPRFQDLTRRIGVSFTVR
jgi:TolB-like protein/Tfp pilus assembly protein PilF